MLRFLDWREATKSLRPSEFGGNWGFLAPPLTGNFSIPGSLAPPIRMDRLSIPSRFDLCPIRLPALVLPASLRGELKGWEALSEHLEVGQHFAVQAGALLLCIGLGVASPFFSTIVLFKNQLFTLGFRRFSRKKDRGPNAADENGIRNATL